VDLERQAATADLRRYLDALELRLDEAHLLLTLVRPDRAAESLKRCLRSASDTLGVARRIARKEFLAVLIDDDPLGEVEEMERRSLLKLVPVLGTAAFAPLDALTRVIESSAQRSPVDAKLVSASESLTTTYAAVYDTAPVAALTQPVALHLDRVTRMLHESLTPEIRRRVSSSLGQVAGFSGWLAFAAGDRAAAARYFVLARDAAQEAQDNVLLASVLASMSDLHSVTQAGPGGGDSEAAVALIDQANDVLPRHAPASIRSWLAARQAVEHAAVRDSLGFERHIERAWNHFRGPAALDEVGFFSDAGRFTTWDAQMIRGFEANALLLLGRTDEAEALLMASPSSDGYPKRRCTRLTSFARIRLDQGDIEESCALAMTALAVANDVGYPLGIARLRALRSEMSGWERRSEVREFDHVLATSA
jgi:hypothetical protein